METTYDLFFFTLPGRKFCVVETGKQIYKPSVQENTEYLWLQIADKAEFVEVEKETNIVKFKTRVTSKQLSNMLHLLELIVED